MAKIRSQSASPRRPRGTPPRARSPRPPMTFSLSPGRGRQGDQSPVRAPTPQLIKIHGVSPRRGETQDTTSVVDDTAEAAGVAQTGTTPAPVPPILPAPFESLDSASALSGAEQSRTDKWNALTSAIKDFLPGMPKPTPTPVKKKKLPDPADPEPKEGTVRMPLHGDIVQACDMAMEDIKKAIATGKKVATKPDRPAPPRFFKPEGAGHFLDPAEVEQPFKDLNHKPLTSPYLSTLSEADLIEREKILRALLCIRSARKWIDEAVMRTVLSMEEIPGMSDWARSLKELLTVAESLSVLELDRLIAEFINTLVQRRDMWLRGKDNLGCHEFWTTQ